MYKYDSVSFTLHEIMQQNCKRGRFHRYRNFCEEVDLPLSPILLLQHFRDTGPMASYFHYMIQKKAD